MLSHSGLQAGLKTMQVYLIELINESTACNTLRSRRIPSCRTQAWNKYTHAYRYLMALNAVARSDPLNPKLSREEGDLLSRSGLLEKNDSKIKNTHPLRKYNVELNNCMAMAARINRSVGLTMQNRMNAI